MTKELWQPIKGYEGLYEVSNFGRVKSLCFGRGHNREKVLKPGNTKGGYLIVCLCKNSHKKWFLVHRLVAEAFIPNPNNLETVNHKDEVKTNNFTSNLEWMTKKDNLNYGTRIKRIVEALGKQVQMFDKSMNLLATFQSTSEAGRATGIDQRNICACCNGNRKTIGGYIWRYL